MTLEATKLAQAKRAHKTKNLAAWDWAFTTRRRRKENTGALHSTIRWFGGEPYIFELN